MFKKIIIVLMLPLMGLSVGYGVGRGLSFYRAGIDSILSTNANAASAEAKSELANIFVEISKKMIPSVVNIFTTQTIKSFGSGRNGDPNEMWRHFFEDFFGGQFGGNGGGRMGPPGRRQAPAPKAQSLGSGFIIEVSNSGGLILTNNHVVEGADEVSVKFTESLDEKDTEAEIIGRDPDLDVALLKVKTRRKLQAAVLNDSDKLEVGEWIAAVGNPFGHGHSVTHGIVSAKERGLPGGFGKYLQVDAPINPGNSGGPLVNLKGEVVGINNAIDARGPGIGFAIPINAVKTILPQLKDKGKVDRGYIGVSVDELTADLAKSLKLDESLKAPIITNVIQGQPADKAGLEPWDVILEVEGKRTYNSAELVGAITSVPIGQVARLKVLRSGGKEKMIEVKVAVRPDFRGALKQPSGKRQNEKRSRGIETGMELKQMTPADARELLLPERYQGVVVIDIVPNSPAHRAGINPRDVILEVDRKPVKTIDGFYSIVKAKKNYLIRVRKVDANGTESFDIVSLKLADAEE